MTPKDVLNLKEASTYLKMDEATLKLLATERRIPCFTSIDTLKAALDGAASERNQTVRTVDEYRLTLAGARAPALPRAAG